MKDRASRHFALWLLYTLPQLAVLLCVVLVMTTTALAMYKEANPEEYSEVVGLYLGSKQKSVSTLNVDDPRLQQIVNENHESASPIDVRELTDTVAAIAWLKTLEPTSNIDIGLSLAIYQHESAGGTNFGNAHAKHTVCTAGRSAAFCNGEISAQTWMLAHWQQYNVVDDSDIAKKYIIVDATGKYVDYIGALAGEIGSNGIIASTGQKICEQYLSKHPDPKMASCNYFDYTVSTYAKIVWLYMIDYDSTQNDDYNFEQLYGWNRDADYRRLLLSDAKSYNEKFAGINLSVNEFSYYTDDDALTEFLDEIVKPLAQELDLWSTSGNSHVAVGDLGPQQWLQYPLAPEDICKVSSCDENGIFSPYGQSRASADGSGSYLHGGDDYPCAAGTPVLAIASGYVIAADDESWNYNSISGYAVYIDHGNGLTSGYFHFMDSPYTDLIEPGQWVDQGQQIGRCGTTGFSSGNHVHFEVRLNGNPGIGRPFDFAGLIDPGNLVGTLVDPADPVR